MEQERYWMWTKRKHDDVLGISPNVLIPTNNSYGDSWEEQAFAEDAAGGPLGGCVWPPRSYSCSFCRREFKSAQALGGHMNVHRRDRARLKQSTNVLPHHAAAVPQVINLPQNHNMLNNNNINPQICTYLYNPSFPDSDQEVVTSLSPSSKNIRVSSAAPPTKDKTGLTPPLTFISPIIQEKSKLVADNSFHVLDFKDEEKSSKSSEFNFRAKMDNFVKADLSVSLDLLVCRNINTNETEDEEISNSKRRKIDSSSFTLFPRSSTMERCSDVLKLSPNSMEDLDLELRLGDPPKVK